MNEYDICTDMVEIVAGTSNRASSIYVEAAKSVEKGDEKGLKYLKNFITSIESLSGKVKDEKITRSRGNIKNFDGYEDVKYSIDFLSKNLGKVGLVKDLISIHNILVEYQPKYSEAYNKNVHLVVLEYECAVYMLVTGLLSLMVNKIDVVQNGHKISIKKISGDASGVTIKTISKLEKQLSNSKHREYLDALLSAKDKAPIDTSVNESTFMEGKVAEVLSLISDVWNGGVKIAKSAGGIGKTIKNTLFGILPLIRCCLYIRYKKKADMVLELDQRVEFIKQNIERLENMNNMDEAKKKRIIYKQKALIERYQKKSAKIRAQLSEGDKDAATAIAKEDPQMKNTDDDFILEGKTIEDIYGNGDSSEFPLQ